MDRRSFTKTAMGAIAGGFAANAVFADVSPAKPLKTTPYKAKFAANFYLNCRDSLKGMPNVDRVRYFYDCGFRAIEDNDMMTRPVEEQKAIAKTMSDLGMEMGVFTCYNGFQQGMRMTGNRMTYKDKADKKAAIANTCELMKKAVEVAKRVNAKWMTVAPGYADQTLDNGYQFANVAEHLKAASEICEKEKLILVLEPLSVRHPGHWLMKISDAYALCKAVGSPSCKILDDIYHQQYTEGNLIKNIDAAWDEIAYFHLGDMPERTEPLSGEVNFKNLIKYIRAKGYDGIFGMEHLQSDYTKGGDQKMFEAYREIDA